VGTSYGAEISFTAGTPGLPTVTTGNVVNKIGAMAEVGGGILSDGGSPIISGGLVWSTTANPDVIINNIGVTSSWFFPSATNFGFISGLTIGTTYYVRAYATNASGTGYGADVSFVATAATLGQIIQNGNVWANVVSVDGTGLHGMIAMQYGNGTATDWGCPGVSVTGTGVAIGTGAANTIAIDASNAACTSVIAPSFTFASAWAGFYGINNPVFYLPSKDEFNMMWTNRATNGLITGFTTTASTTFWSSSEVDLNQAYILDITTGTWSGALKTSAHDFWAVASF
jgi:hypothetical protein